MATTFKTVVLGSVAARHAGTPFGLTADESLGKVRVIDPADPATPQTGDFRLELV